MQLEVKTQPTWNQYTIKGNQFRKEIIRKVNEFRRD